jgi:hypothetical protein
MLFRLPLFLLFFLSLAFGPVQVAAGCPPVKQRSCGPCCSEAQMPCCATADESAPAQGLESVALQSMDGKVAAPAFVLLETLYSVPAPKLVVVPKWQVARLPVPPRLDLNCIRLI